MSTTGAYPPLSGARRTGLSALSLAAACVIAGCGGEAMTTDVHGKISFKNQPVTSGVINFRSTSGKIMGGEIQSDGSYRYSLPPGEYTVRVESIGNALIEGQAPGTAAKPVGVQVPAKYANYATSGLTATVSADKSDQTIDFILD